MHKERELDIAAAAEALSWRFRAAHGLNHLLPPLIAPTVSERVYPFEVACREAFAPWITSISGSHARWPIDDIHGYHFALHRYHDWRLLVVAQVACTTGDTIIEVGANIGTETIGFCDTVGSEGRVVALEPFPTNVERLRRVISDARLSNVTMLPVAAGDYPGTLPFVTPDNEHFTGVGHLGNEVRGSESVIQVKVITLDQLFEHRPAFIAMDVEGAELAVLRGARTMVEKHRPVIALEACARHAVRAGNNLVMLRSELEDMDYVVRAIRRYGLGAADTSETAEPCNWVAVPSERFDLLPQISSRIFWSGILPPWRGLNPLVAA